MILANNVTYWINQDIWLYKNFGFHFQNILMLALIILFSTTMILYVTAKIKNKNFESKPIRKIYDRILIIYFLYLVVMGFIFNQYTNQSDEVCVVILNLIENVVSATCDCMIFFILGVVLLCLELKLKQLFSSEIVQEAEGSKKARK